MHLHKYQFIQKYMLITRILKALFKIKYTLYFISCKYKKYYENFSYDFKKNGELNLINKLSKTDIKVVFDVGANVGSYTKLIKDYLPKCSIHAFELHKGNFSILKKNISGLNIFLNDFGLYNISKQIRYKAHKYNSTNHKISSRSGSHDSDKFDIEIGVVQTGDNYCEKKNINNIDLLKIDVEGSEFQVLLGFKKMIEKNKIKIIQFEYGYANGDNKNLIRDFYDFLSPHGYKIGPLKNDGVWIMNFKLPLNNFTSGPNYVAILESKINTKLLKKSPKTGFANL